MIAHTVGVTVNTTANQTGPNEQPGAAVVGSEKEIEKRAKTVDAGNYGPQRLNFERKTHAIRSQHVFPGECAVHGCECLLF